MESHENIRKYACGVCGAKFNNVAGRNGHERELHLKIKKGALKKEIVRSRKHMRDKNEEDTFEVRKARWLKQAAEQGLVLEPMDFGVR